MKRAGLLLLITIPAAVVVASCFACLAPKAPELPKITVVRMDCPGGEGWGSGVRLDKDNVLTAGHVGACFAVPWDEADPDVAIIQIPGATPVQPAFRAPVLGEAVYCWGYPATPSSFNTEGLTVTEGVVANTERLMGDRQVQVTCAVRGGMSGGPVVAESDGAVVGIIVAYWPTVQGWSQMEPAPFDLPYFRTPLESLERFLRQAQESTVSGTTSP